MHEYEHPCCDYNFWLYLIICLVIVSLAGITSGLALGILSYNPVDLEVLIKAGRPKDKKNAGWLTLFLFL
jgi:metal transporter CNNM